VLGLRFLRNPNAPDTTARLLASLTVIHADTRTHYQYGARQLRDAQGVALPDATTITALSGLVIKRHTADGDVSHRFHDAAGRPLWSLSAQGTVKRFAYEPRETAGRPLTVSETAVGAAGAPRVREAFAYGPPDEFHRARNLTGAIIVHHDNAGFTETLSVSLTDQARATRLSLLPPETELADWGATMPPATETPLEWSATYDAAGGQLSQTNAAAVTTVNAYDLCGAIAETRMRYTEKGMNKELITLRDILRSAEGVVVSQTAGNGLLEAYEYDPRTRHLARHSIQRDALTLSDLNFTYDPAGNVLSLNEAATDRQWHRNRVTGGQRDYLYDTLYRLAAATGRERLADAARGPQTRLRANASAWFPYGESYSYDDGDNLIKTVHLGNCPWSRHITVSASTNRALLNDHPLTPESGFLAGGLQTQLTNGRKLAWYADGQLQQVSPLVRAAKDADDTEAYRYSNGGARVRKISVAKVASGARSLITTYAGGLETRQRRLGDSLQLDIIITDGGVVRLTQDRLTGEAHLRYSLKDPLGSHGGETDAAGYITSYEEYYPYGGSAGADEEKEEIHHRTSRYSGKERDATGLVYYGWRYYQPEAGRWLSADPGELIDGVNLYRFCSNNPLKMRDEDGRVPTLWDEIMHHKDAGYPSSKPTLSKLKQKSKEENYQLMAAEIEHHLSEESHVVHSQYKAKNPGSSRGTPGFTNEFHPGIWKLKRNFKADSGRVHASNVVLKQYSLVAKREKFYGVLPKVILRWGVTNRGALDATSIHENDPTDVTQREQVMRQRFLEKSDNGKHTQRILHDLGLTATRVERFTHHDGLTDNEIIAVFVSPNEDQDGQDLPTAHELLPEQRERVLRRDQRAVSDVQFMVRQVNRNPLSQALHSAWRSTTSCVRSRTTQ
jgi:insecticidal toxin complex protein TccC